MKDIQKGVTALDCEPTIERETVATALVDGSIDNFATDSANYLSAVSSVYSIIAYFWIIGRNLLGPVVGNFAMQLAIQKVVYTYDLVVFILEFTNTHCGALLFSISFRRRQPASDGLLHTVSPLQRALFGIKSLNYFSTLCNT